MSSSEKPFAPHALVVEDDQEMREALIAELQGLGFEVHEASGSCDAHSVVDELRHDLDLVIVDLVLAEHPEGWSVAHHARKVLPGRCEVAILTGHPSWRPATVGSELRFFQKMVDHAAFETFIETTAMKAIARRSGESSELPKVDSNVPDLQPAEELACKAITEAERVVVCERLMGSFQRRTVLLVEVSPRPAHGGFTKPYFGILKRESWAKCKQEEENARRLDFDVGANSAQVRIPTVYMSLNRADEATMVSPVGGDVTLEAMVKRNWFRSDVSKHAFLHTCERLRSFLLAIGTITKPCRHATSEITNQRFDRSKREGSQRLERSLAVLRDLVPSKKPLLRVPGVRERIVNPRYVLENLTAIPWDSTQHPCKTVGFGHGDFHLRNIVDKTFEGNHPLCIVDFEHVAENPCQYFDTAQLEASFLLALASSDKTAVGPEKCRRALSAALSYTAVEAGIPGDQKRIQSQTKTTTEIVRGVSAIRGRMEKGDMPLYSAALWPAMLRLTVGFVENDGKQFSSESRRTAVTCMGLHLSGTLAAGALSDADIGEFDA